MLTIIPALYFSSFILSLYYIYSGKLNFSRSSHWLFKSAVVLQIILLISKTIDFKINNIETSLFVTSVFLSIPAFFFIRQNMKNLYCFFVSPVGFILTIPLLMMGNEDGGSTYSNRMIIIHVLLNILSHTTLLISSIFSMMFIYQHRNFKNKKVKKISRMPSLSLIEKINFNLILISFPIMTIGLSLGFLLSKNQIGSYWFGTVSAISIFSWLIYFSLIQMRIIYNLSGLKVSILSLIGFTSIIISYLFMYVLNLPSHTFV
ncbi:cytochrome c biogenesis protein CcsA [bacterium]|nr:cytochrome c biogenesis protein CcsA [bacterium]MBT3795400.1 cytochrome c biogenesis protein CcsA [bacterium]MBT4634021.1 cytochrome c biogenesis protein CcsA [bacterium]